MRKTTSVLVSILLSSAIASGCISVHKKETKEVPATTVEHHDTVVVP
jgi:hypothetical protein